MGTEAIMEEDLQRNTNHLLHRLGLTANYRGYFYVSYGIVLCAKEQERLLLVTKGKEGSTAFWREHQVSRPGFPVEAIDTTGAGDTFCGCCLHHILEWGLKNLDEERLGEMLSFANAAAGLVTTRKGALRSMPEEAEVRRLLANR